jgi:hypothetical protein
MIERRLKMINRGRASNADKSILLDALINYWKERALKAEASTESPAPPPGERLLTPIQRKELLLMAHTLSDPTLDVTDRENELVAYVESFAAHPQPETPLREALDELVTRKPDIPEWSHSASVWIYKGERISDGKIADHRWLQDLSRWADEVAALRERK